MWIKFCGFRGFCKIKSGLKKSVKVFVGDKKVGLMSYSVTKKSGKSLVREKLSHYSNLVTFPRLFSPDKVCSPPGD